VVTQASWKNIRVQTDLKIHRRPHDCWQSAHAGKRSKPKVSKTDCWPHEAWKLRSEPQRGHPSKCVKTKCFHSSAVATWSSACAACPSGRLAPRSHLTTDPPIPRKMQITQTHDNKIYNILYRTYIYTCSRRGAECHVAIRLRICKLSASQIAWLRKYARKVSR